MSDSRNEQMIRIFRLIDYLANTYRGKSIHQIHEHFINHGFNVSERTVRRDIKALETIFVPFVEEKGEDGIALYSLDPKAIQKQPFVMTPKALIGLFLVRGLATQLKSSPFFPDLQDLFITIDSCLSDKSRAFFSEITQTQQFSMKQQDSHRASGEIYKTLQAVCLERQWIVATYESVRSGSMERKLGPHSLYHEKGAFYLLAEDAASCEVKTFALSRFRSVEILDEAFTAETIDAREFYKNSFGVFRGTEQESIVLEFERELSAHAAETQWHPTQTVELIEGERLRMKLLIPITPDVINWILGFGSQVNVIAPLSLQEKVLEIAESLVSRYSSRKLA